MPLTDPIADLHTIADGNWDAGIIAKPTLTTRPTGKIHKKHAANTIYFLKSRRKDTPYNYTYDTLFRVEVLIIGTTLANMQELERGLVDAIHEYLDDAGRTYQYIVCELEEQTRTKPRSDFRMSGIIHMTREGATLAT